MKGRRPASGPDDADLFFAEEQQPAPGAVLSIKQARRGKVRIAIQGEETPLELSRETIAAFPVREGEILAVSELHRLLQEDARQEARSRALRFLETRERSTAELRLRLRRYGYEEEVIEATVRYLADLSYLDDRRFAMNYAREKLGGGWGARRIRAELARKGVGRALISEVLAEVDEPEHAIPSALDGSLGEPFSDATVDSAPTRVGREADLLALVERKFGRELRSDRVRAERRAASFLARRGHDWERIDCVLREWRARVSGDEE